ncbi:MAG: hypothetical protein ACC645_23680 [Pirellulales bacterium]
MSRYDLLVKNVNLVRPGSGHPNLTDITVGGQTFAAVTPSIDRAQADQVIDAHGLLGFPGVIDCHQHWGIYNPLEEDARTESRACAQGGVTTGITYTRTGQYYLNRGGPYSEFLPELLKRAEGRAFVDYGFHLAPMMSQHIDELETLVAESSRAGREVAEEQERPSDAVDPRVVAEQP